MGVCNFLKYLIGFWIPFLLFTHSANATVYSNAENGIDGWVVSDNLPAGAEITSMFDANQGSAVIQTNGDGRNNGYSLGGTNATVGWNNTSQPVLSWDMSTDEPFVLTVHIDTDFGARRIVYSQSNSDGLKNPANNTIGFGLGSAVIGAGWNSHTRNLSNDVTTGEPGNQLLAINGVTVLGSLRLDNVELTGGNTEPPEDEQFTVYSDAENGTDGWVVFDNTPPGASISSVFDSDLGSRVIQTNGDGRSNIYLIGGINAATGWNNSSQFALSWDMSTDELFTFMVYVDTDLGVRRLVYTNSNSDGLKNPTNNTIGFGLSSSVVGAGWSLFTRDLAGDVAIGEPGNNLLAVNGIAVYGSYRLDNIRLADSVETPHTPEITEPPEAPETPETPETPEAPETPETPEAPEAPEAPTLDIADTTAARLLAQATFGATLADIAAVKQLGVEGWVDDQFTRQGTSHLDYVSNHPGSSSLTGPRQHKWLLDAIDGSDQLRQRVAFAYSEIFVTSDITQTLKREQHAMTNYYDLLRNNAFSNYRDLLEEVTLSPIMGIYLSMLQNSRGDPATNTRADENFAREIMQLFSIGLHELNLDGTIRRDASGNPVPAYTQQNIEEYARVFTGWSYAGTDRFDHEPADSFTNKFLPMEQFPGFHDFGEKDLLRGVVSPAGITAEEDLDIALDSIFNHPNVGPFIGKQLILRLVTSNPTPAYVARVAATFNNNGSGERGDMRAVIRAVLLDTEARSGYSNVPNYGKLREPLIRWTHLWRAFNVQRGQNSANEQYNHASPYIYQGAEFLGQGVLSAPSVFNFFHPDYAPLGDIRDAGLVAPEAEIYSDSYILTTTAKLSGLAHIYYQGGNDNTLNSSYIDITAETALASDPDALISRLDLLLMSGQMTSGMRAVLLSHMNGLPSDEAGRSLRVRDGIALIMASPQYLVQK